MILVLCLVGMHLRLFSFLLRRNLRLHSIRRLSIILNAHVYFVEWMIIQEARNPRKETLENIHAIVCKHNFTIRMRLCVNCVCLCSRWYVLQCYLLCVNIISYFLYRVVVVRVTVVTLYYEEPSNWENRS